MCHTVKDREGVGRLAKLAVRPRRFITHKKTHDFEYKYKTQENSNFLKNGKMVISIKIQIFSRFRMKKRTSSLESSREI